MAAFGILLKPAHRSTTNRAMKGALTSYPRPYAGRVCSQKCRLNVHRYFTLRRQSIAAALTIKLQCILTRPAVVTALALLPNHRSKLLLPLRRWQLRQFCPLLRTASLLTPSVPQEKQAPPRRMRPPESNSRPLPSPRWYPRALRRPECAPCPYVVTCRPP